MRRAGYPAGHHPRCTSNQFYRRDPPVIKPLAGQRLLPLGIGAHFHSGGGVFRTLALSLHATTHIEILHRFRELDVQVEQEGRDNSESAMVFRSKR